VNTNYIRSVLVQGSASGCQTYNRWTSISTSRESDE